ncbi:MAG: WhiB family transcriptional regulator [Nitriliruptorales bacterium]
MPDDVADELSGFVIPGAVAASTVWVKAVTVGDFDAFWSLMTYNFRLVTAQMTVWRNRDATDEWYEPDDIARRLALLKSDHPFRPEFERVNVEAFLKYLPDGFDLATWGFGSHRRAAPGGGEIVLWMETGGEMLTIDEETIVTDAHIHALRVEDGDWKVAAVDYHETGPRVTSNAGRATGGPVEGPTRPGDSTLRLAGRRIASTGHVVGEPRRGPTPRSRCPRRIGAAIPVDGPDRLDGGVKCSETSQAARTVRVVIAADFETLTFDGWGALVALGSRALPAILPRPPAWTVRARCRDADPEMLYAEKGDRLAAAAAKRLCRSCDVRPECLDLALELERGLSASMRASVWGRLSPSERAVLDRQVA